MVERTPNGPYSETPLTKSFPLSATVPFQVYLKNEFTQPSGSFKSRGLGHLVSAKVKEAAETQKQISLFSSSGGNAGLAASVAASYYNVPCTVVLPETSKPRMRSKIEQTGANVIVKGKHWGEADAYLKNEIIAKLDTSESLPVYCHPFDDQLVWEGNSTMIDEIKYQLGDKIGNLKGIICSVGGGGMYTGIVRGLIRNDLHVPVIAVETEGAPSLHNAIALGKIVTLDSVDTIATSLASPYAAAAALQYAKTYPTHSVLIKDEQSLSSLLQFSKDHNVIVEPACAASLTPIYEPEIVQKYLGELGKDDIVVVIVCGGSSYTLSDLISLTQN